VRTDLERLEAGNLGQVIARGLIDYPAAVRPVFGEVQLLASAARGRTVHGRDCADPADESPLGALPVRSVKGRGNTGAQGPTARIREALRNHPEGMHLGPLCGAVNLDRNNTSAALKHMHDVERTGGRRNFLYRLKTTENS
jgi:hypothetical protein